MVTESYHFNICELLCNLGASDRGDDFRGIHKRISSERIFY